MQELTCYGYGSSLQLIDPPEAAGRAPVDSVEQELAARTVGGVVELLQTLMGLARQAPASMRR
jgi:hypothetical protein